MALQLMSTLKVANSKSHPKGRLDALFFIYWCIGPQNYPYDRRDTFMKLLTNQ
ncbi:hypothetical protein POAR111328_10565 [Polynucleobacter arcticus]